MARRGAARTVKPVLLEVVAAADAPLPGMFPVPQTIFAVLLDIPATVMAPTTLNAASPRPTLTLRLRLRLRPRLPAHLYQPTHQITTAATITPQTRVPPVTATTIQTRITMVRTVPVKTSPVLPAPSPARPLQGPVQLLFRALPGPPRPMFRTMAVWIGRVLGVSLVVPWRSL